MTNVWRVSEVEALGVPPGPDAAPIAAGDKGTGLTPDFSSPLVGEEGAHAKRGKVRGNARGLTKRQMLPSTTTARARQLRRDRTEAEDVLWRALRVSFAQAKFRFQVPIGRYYADFCSHGAKLIIEVDGATHAESIDEDAARTRFINGEGYRVLRFWNNEVMGNLEGVIERIAAYIPAPLPGQGRMRGSDRA